MNVSSVMRREVLIVVVEMKGFDRGVNVVPSEKKVATSGCNLQDIFCIFFLVHKKGGGPLCGVCISSA